MAIKVIDEDEYKALIKRIEALEYKQKLKDATPLAIEWISQEQALKYLKIASPKTLVKLRNRGLIEYRKEVKKVEYYLPSLIAYRERTHIKPDVILGDVQRMSA